MAEVWPGLVVEESNLTYHMSAIRRALGDQAGNREYIITSPARGYRFIAPVQETGEAPEAGPAEPTPAPAVLPEPERAPDVPVVPDRPVSWAWIGGATLLVLVVVAVMIRGRNPAEPAAWKQLTLDRAEDTQPDLSPDGRFVTFVSNRAGYHDIWRMNADGSGAVNLTHGGSDSDSPAWSPDGRRIAFQNSRTGGVPHLYVINADGTGEREVTQGSAARATWSPDGRWLLYQSSRDHGSGIFRLDVATGAETRLTAPGVNSFDPAFSPDGRTIVFTRESPRGLQLFLMAPDGQKVRQLTNFYGISASVPAWSPDGSRIAFTGARDRESGVFVMRANGTEAFRLTTGFTGAGEAAWSRDSKRIYFESDHGGNSDVYSIDVPAGTARRLTSDVGEDSEPVYAPSGGEIAFMSNRNGKVSLFLEELGSGRMFSLTHATTGDSDPSWSPDGGFLAFASTRNGRSQIFVLSRKDGSVRQVSPNDGEWVQPAWSPDGQRLAAVWGPAGSTRLRILSVHGGAPVEAAPDYVGAGWPVWSADGTTIAFDGSRGGAPYQVYSVPAAGGPVRLMSDGSHTSGHPSWRPDGALAFNCNCGSGTQIMVREPDGSVHPVTDALPRNFLPSFSKDGGRIVFASTRDGNMEIYEVYN